MQIEHIAGNSTLAQMGDPLLLLLKAAIIQHSLSLALLMAWRP
jgi:hypothetical protein